MHILKDRSALKYAGFGVLGASLVTAISLNYAAANYPPLATETTQKMAEAGTLIGIVGSIAGIGMMFAGRARR